MQTKRAWVLNVDEARKSLINTYVTMFQQTQLLREEIESGRILTTIPDFSKLPGDKVAALYAELCLGEEILHNDQTLDLVLVQTDEYKYEFAAHREQITPGKPLGPVSLTDADDAVQKVFSR